MKILKRRLKNKDKTCPDNDTLVRAFLGLLGLAEKERLVDHVLECPTCMAKFDALRRLSLELGTREEDLPEEALSKGDVRSLKTLASQRIKELEKRPAVKKAKIFRFIPFPILATAAALLVVAVGVILVFMREPERIYRQADVVSLTLIAPQGRVAEAPSLFTWSPLAHTDLYFFWLVDEELNTLHHRGSQGTRIVLSEEIRSKLVRGKIYVWKVEARDEWRNLTGSGVQSFTIQ